MPKNGHHICFGILGDYFRHVGGPGRSSWFRVRDLQVGLELLVRATPGPPKYPTEWP